MFPLSLLNNPSSTLTNPQRGLYLLKRCWLRPQLCKLIYDRQTGRLKIFTKVFSFSFSQMSIGQRLAGFMVCRAPEICLASTYAYASTYDSTYCHEPQGGKQRRQTYTELAGEAQKGKTISCQTPPYAPPTIPTIDSALPCWQPRDPNY